MSYLQEALERKKQELEQLIRLTTEEHAHPLSEKLYVTRNGKHHYYYLHSTDAAAAPRNKTYLSCKETELLHKYAQHEYDTKIYESAQEIHSKINQMLSTYQSSLFSDIYLQTNPGKQILIDPYVMPDEMYAEQWQNITYEPNTIEIGDSNLLTMKNERVRSKSEMAIADRLNQYGIPYHYEMPLRVDHNLIFYPDFTVLNVRTRTVYYWEHLGMMDDPDYLEKNLRKLDSYESAGYVIGKNLIITYETSKRPLNMMSVRRNIETFLL